MKRHIILVSNNSTLNSENMLAKRASFVIVLRGYVDKGCCIYLYLLVSSTRNIRLIWLCLKWKGNYSDVMPGGSIGYETRKQKLFSSLINSLLEITTLKNIFGGVLKTEKFLGSEKWNWVENTLNQNRRR